MEEPKLSLGALLTRFSTQISTLFRAEIALTKAQVKESGKRFGLAAGLLGTAAVFALFMLGWLITAMFFGFAALLGASVHGLALAALICAAILALVAGILALCGIKAAKAAQQRLPDPAAGVKKNVEVITSTARSAVEKVNEGTK